MLLVKEAAVIDIEAILAEMHDATKTHMLLPHEDKEVLHFEYVRRIEQHLRDALDEVKKLREANAIGQDLSRCTSLQELPDDSRAALRNLRQEDAMTDKCKNCLRAPCECSTTAWTVKYDEPGATSGHDQFPVCFRSSANQEYNVYRFDPAWWKERKLFHLREEALKHVKLFRSKLVRVRRKKL